MKNNPLPQLEQNSEICEKLLPLCRLRPGEIWQDPHGGHKVGCLDVANKGHIDSLMDNSLAQLAIHDPPYNLVTFEERKLKEYIDWCREWIRITSSCLDEDSSLYVWLGADQTKGFQPLPDFMIMMREFAEFKARSFVTMRNQRGYGTHKNWMAVRQELLYYVKGNPPFEVQYTDIPKILRGYYKQVNGQVTENTERSKSTNIRASNVWVDVQQVFYRMKENVSGCYAQKPLKAIDRIVSASSKEGDLVLDFFAHSGTTLISCQRHNRRCFTIDVNPVFCEIAIRRLELYRQTGMSGWQNGHPFEDAMDMEQKNNEVNKIYV